MPGPMIEIESLAHRTYCNQCPPNTSERAVVRAKFYGMAIYVCEGCAQTLSKELTAAKFTLANLLAHLGMVEEPDKG